MSGSRIINAPEAGLRELENTTPVPVRITPDDHPAGPVRRTGCATAVGAEDGAGQRALSC